MRRLRRRGVRRYVTRFNPHPAWKPDATPAATPDSACGQCFNPHPAWKPDATQQEALIARAWAEFQSSPGLEAGCDTANEPSHRCGSAKFQSSPGLEAGCDTSEVNTGCTSEVFQSSPGLEAGCDGLGSVGVVALGMFQSSPGLEAGCDASTQRCVSGS